MDDALRILAIGQLGGWLIIRFDIIEDVEWQEHVKMAMFALFAFFRLVRMVEPARLVAGRDAIPLGIMLILNERGVCRYHSGY